MKNEANYVGAHGRIDFSGARGGVRRPLSKRDMTYPYDNAGTSYGQNLPLNAQPRSKPSGDPPVPKDTEHTIWDEIDEAMGTPYAFRQADGGRGGSTGGRVAPGTAISFAYYSDDEEMPDSELSKYGEQKMWEKLKEAFVSLRDTPEGQLTLSQGLEEAELEATLGEFAEENKKAEQFLSSCSEAEMVQFLMDLDPEHAAESLGKCGKDSLMGIYRKWVAADGARPHDQELTNETDD